MNLLYERNNEHSEKYLQQKVINNLDLQKIILEKLEIDFNTAIKFTKGKTYANRILPDVKVARGNEILALIECKGAKIKVTDYVRGIGQLLQYEYFYEKGITENQSDKYSKNFKTLYLYPDDVIKNNDFNISNFKYPRTTTVLHINLKNFAVAEFTEKDKIRYSSLGESLIAISKYYFRDNRIFELYILVKYLRKKFLKSKVHLDRTRLEVDHLRIFKTPNNNNWRNAFITLSIMGLISKKNNLTQKGKEFSSLKFHEFCSMVFFDYCKPYVDEVFKILVKKPNIKLQDLLKKIKLNNNGKDILFLTQSETRYLSSWLNIFRDDFGFISFIPKQNTRVINYNPLNISKNNLEKNIVKFSKASPFIEKLDNI